MEASKSAPGIIRGMLPNKEEFINILGGNHFS